MDELREIVTVEQVEHWFIVLAVALPIVGAAIGAALGARKQNLGRGALAGFAAGLLGPLNLLLWHTYNGITDRLGLDRVSNLLVNVALFIGLGGVAGFVLGILSRRRLSPESAPAARSGFEREPAVAADSKAAKE